MENKENKSKVDAEKIACYLVITTTILAAIIYIADIKERLRAVEVKIECKNEKTTAEVKRTAEGKCQAKEEKPNESG